MKAQMACLGFVFAATLTAHSRLIPCYRMDSYAFLSDDLVLCDEEKVQVVPIQHEKWLEVKTVVLCKARQTFKGDIKPEEEFQIEYDSLFHRSFWNKQGYVEEDPSGLKRVVQPEYLPAGRALLFLRKEKTNNSRNVVTAKLVQANGIYRFVQSMDPGPLVLVPQKPENIRLKNGQKYDEGALIADLLIALQKVPVLKKPVPEFK